MSYKVLDVCRHVINYSNEHDYGISGLFSDKKEGPHSLF